MAFEFKMFIVMMAEIVKRAESVEEIYKALDRMAAIEGVKIVPFNEEKENEKKKDE